ncbi:hypothetical protein F5883DRAFT_722199 [Diaporthe sp. PMI_573]|nr:hypothetical protein F5883DRAFT_722199 [Diaporthaceae sp. PMI_573]
MAVFTRSQARQRALDFLEHLRNVRAAQDAASGDVIVFDDFPGLAYKIFLELAKKDDTLYRRFQELRYNYSHKREELVIRMPNKIRDGLAEFLGRKIGSWLEALTEVNGSLTSTQDRAGVVSDDIVDYGTANMSILSDINSEDSKEDVRQADKSYEYQVQGSEETLPDLVIEVIWSHPRTRGQLSQRAEEYIVNSGGKVRTVVLIDLLDFYPDPTKSGSRQKCGKFSILRAKVGRKGRAMVDEMSSVRGKNVIAGVNEAPVAGANLELSLLDFVSECKMSSLSYFEGTRISADHLRETSIVITAEQLYKRFEAVRIGWLKAQTKQKLKKKQSEDATSVVKGTAPKDPKGKD